MQGRYPRTVREFAETGRVVIVHCSHCNHARRVPPDVLEAVFGPDFDRYAGYAGLVTELHCDQCAGPGRVIDFIDTNPQATGPVSFEDSVTSQLEFRALVRAQGQESTATRERLRRRR
jgi:hypothetical protein